MGETGRGKVVFVHHSVGGHWLAHDGGGLVSAMNRSGFYVNDITYGWQPGWLTDSRWKRLRSRIRERLLATHRGPVRIGDRTDIGYLPGWFLGPEADRIMSAVYRESAETDRFGDHSNLTSASPVQDPGAHLENGVVMMKPCYPNSLYRGDGNDPASSREPPSRGFSAGSEAHTVANCKRIYNDILVFMRTQTDKFFVLVTAPPRLSLPEGGAIARAFSNWLALEWLSENDYDGQNVMVFDLFNVLTSGLSPDHNDLGAEGGNHHRIWQGREQHQVRVDNHTLAYPRGEGDNHPSPAGLRKATEEFMAVFESRLGMWSQGRTPPDRKPLRRCSLNTAR